MGIKWLDKSHRSPVSCNEISRDRSRTGCIVGVSRALALVDFLNVHSCQSTLILQIIGFTSITLFQQYSVLIDQKDKYADGKYRCLKSLNGHDWSCCMYHSTPL